MPLMASVESSRLGIHRPLAVKQVNLASTRACFLLETSIISAEFCETFYFEDHELQADEQSSSPTETATFI